MPSTRSHSTKTQKRRDPMKKSSRPLPRLWEEMKRLSH
jgi:hypothetical protein